MLEAKTFHAAPDNRGPGYGKRSHLHIIMAEPQFPDRVAGRDQLRVGAAMSGCTLHHPQAKFIWRQPAAAEGYWDGETYSETLNRLDTERIVRRADLASEEAERAEMWGMP